MWILCAKPPQEACMSRIRDFMAYLVMLEADHYRVRDPSDDDIRMTSCCMFRHRKKGRQKPPLSGPLSVRSEIL